MTDQTEQERAQRVGDEVFATLFGAVPPVAFATLFKRQRAKPHRCPDCGKVTKHVRCDACAKARRDR